MSAASDFWTRLRARQGSLTNKEAAVNPKPMLEETFIIKAPLERTWELLSDMEKFGSCIPGCKEVRKISETEYEWVLEAKVLRTSRTIVAKTQVTETKPPVHASFQGEGELHERFSRYRVALSGATDLEPISEGETKITFSGGIHASGAGGFIINKIVSGQMQGLLRDFEQNIRAALEK